MRLILERGGLAVAGLVTAFATAVVLAAIFVFTGWDLLSIVVKAIVPVGAIFGGAAAASGYFFGARWLHIQPSKSLLLQVVLTAGATMLFFYLLIYAVAILLAADGASIPSFGRFLEDWLTHSHIYSNLAGGPGGDRGEAGGDAYLLAIIEFVGLTIGGLWVVFALMGQAVCPTCEKYLQVLAKKQDRFADEESFMAYYAHEFDHPVGSAEFARHVGARHKANAFRSGALRLTTRILSCSQCATQTVEETVRMHDGREWAEVHGLSRSVDIPGGVDVAPAYRNGGSAPAV